MVKKKKNLSIFSTIVSKLGKDSPSADCQMIDNEYFVGFERAVDAEEFYSKINEENSDRTNSNTTEIDMKTFAEQFLIDAPSQKRKQIERTSSNSETQQKRARRQIEPTIRWTNSSSTFDDDPTPIFDFIDQQSSPSKPKQIESNEIPSILQTLQNFVKTEPTESLVEVNLPMKQEPIESEYVPSRPMNFGTNRFTGCLDDFVQNIHLSINEPVSTRPKRIRKRKKYYIEESESIAPRRRNRKKTAPPTRILTDAEIEQQFGERLSPTMKTETVEENSSRILANQRMIIEIEPINQTPIERARAKLIKALRRAGGPDEFLLKIRTRENKIIEIQLAIYGTTDWHGHRTKILNKIEEALRGLRVSWTKIDLRVDDYDIELCTSGSVSVQSLPAFTIANNSSWFLKILSESGPLIVHIHDRRFPQQRFGIRCPCPRCSNEEKKIKDDSSLPVIVNVSPNKLKTPSILRRTSSTIQFNSPSLKSIETVFFKELIHRYGTGTVSSVTQCVLDLTLIVSVHKSFDFLRHCSSDSNEENYEEKYQQIIDPLKCTKNEPNSNCFASSQPSISDFYHKIKENRANIRNPEAMRNVINSFPLATVKKKPLTTLIIPKISRAKDFFIQKPNFTPFIELEPIGFVANSEKQAKKTGTTTVQTTKEIPSPPNNGARVIRLSIQNKNSPQPTFRLISSSPTVNKDPTVPLVPKQINIIKTLSSSTITANKLTNPILIVNQGRDQPLTK